MPASRLLHCWIYACLLLGCGPQPAPPVEHSQPLPAEHAEAPPIELAEPPPVRKRAAAEVPERVVKVLEYVDKHHKPPKDHEGGREFHNNERLLPRRDAHGEPIRYQEWDVNPKVPGRSRDAERLVTGSDGSAHYTLDHYKTFIKIR